MPFRDVSGADADGKIASATGTTVHRMRQIFATPWRAERGSAACRIDGFPWEQVAAQEPRVTKLFQRFARPVSTDHPRRPRGPADSCEETRGHRPDGLVIDASTQKDCGYTSCSRRLGVFSAFSHRIRDVVHTRMPPQPHDQEAARVADASTTAPLEFERKYYDTGKVLGRGSYATVRIVSKQAPDQVTGRCGLYASKELRFACKGSGDRREVDGVTAMEDAKREVDITRALSHPHIIQIREAYFEEDLCRIIMPCLCGGDMLDALRLRGSLAEEDARLVVSSLFSALEYIHGKGIAHCDVKLENLMLQSSSDFGSVKLIDFGLAKKVGRHGRLSRASGTPLYVAPEVITFVDSDLGLSKYGVQCDMWACGVVLFTLLGGAPPFRSDSYPELLATIMRGQFDFFDPAWELVSADAKDLIVKLLEIRPEKRISATEALRHPWVCQ